MVKKIYKFKYTDSIGTVHTYFSVEKGDYEISECKIINLDQNVDGETEKGNFTINSHTVTLDNDEVSLMVSEAKEHGEDFEEISDKNFIYEMQKLAEKLGEYLVK